MAGKVSQASVHYRAGSRSRHCALCIMFEPPDSCSDVAGDIEPDGVCDIFKRKAAKSAADRARGRYGSKS